jgi:ATP synthase protein I
MSAEDSRNSLDDLDTRLRRARESGQRHAAKNRGTLRAPTSGLGIAFRIGVEMVAALVLGVGIGLLLDRWLDTAPWFLLLFFFLGSAAGILNVYRTASGLGLAVGYRPPDEGTKANKGSNGSTEGR